MAHEISIVNGVAEAYFAEKAAWHNLGTVTKEAKTAKEAIVISHLDYPIGVHQLIHRYRKIENGVDLGYYEQPSEFYYTVREDTQVVLGAGMSEGYEPLQNVEAFEFMDSLSDTGMVYESAFALGKGERIVVLARMPQTDEVADGDIQKRYLMLFTTHDGSGSVQVRPTSVRVVCANTLAMAMREKESSIKIKHTQKMQERLAIARTMIKAADHEFGRLLQQSRELAKVKISTENFKNYLSAIYPLADDASGSAKTRHENVTADVTKIFHEEKTCNLDSIKGTWWAAFNAVTFREDHDGSTRVRNGSNAAETRFRSIVEGTAAKRKTLALETALKMADIAIAA